jgi:hypothetical protein
VSNGATIAGIRLGAAAVIVAGLCVQAWADLTYGTFTWSQLPVYFTPLAAIAAIAALICAALTGPVEPRWVSLLRVNATTYAVITGVVYWSLLANYGHPKFPWANAIIHGGTGVILVVDWVFIGQRKRLPWHTLWTVFGVPAVWLGYVALDAALDGWVPYPFLDPTRGIGRLVGTVAVMLAAGLIVATALRWCTGFRVVGREPALARVADVGG